MSTVVSGRPSVAVRSAAVLYGLVCYAAFVVVFGYAIGFVAGALVPRSVDSALEAPVAQAVVIDVGLLTLFALQHSVMARPGFKQWWARYVPAAIERSTYVLLSSAALALVFWQWREIDTTVWHVDSEPVRLVLAVLTGVGWVTVVASTFMIDHFEMFGLRQILHVWRAKAMSEKGFRMVLLYRLIRHPLYLGFQIAFWSTPTMTGGHLVVAATTTVYILVAVRFEERDLVADLGEPYRRYRQRVPMLFPCPVRRTQ